MPQPGMILNEQLIYYGIPGYNIHIFKQQSTIIEFARNDLVNVEPDLDYDFVFFIDADIGFDKDTMTILGIDGIPIMIKKMKQILDHDLFICGGYYTMRAPPHLPNVLAHLEGDVYSPILKPPSEGVYEVGALATGFLCIKKVVFDKFKAKNQEIRQKIDNGKLAMSNIKKIAGEDEKLLILSKKSMFTWAKIYIFVTKPESSVIKSTAISASKSGINQFITRRRTNIAMPIWMSALRALKRMLRKFPDSPSISIKLCGRRNLMADINMALQVIQGRVGNDNQAFVRIIENAIYLTWAEVAARFDLNFLKAPAPQSVTLVTGQKVYSLKEFTGRMRYISDGDGKKVWTYVPWQTFEEYCSDSTGTVSVFTDYGKKSGKQQIRVEPEPDSSGTYYLHYNELGTIATFNLLPDSWLKTMIHGAMSILAPPIERRSPNDIIWWKAVTKDEDKLFEAGLIKMLLAQPISPDIPANRLDNYTNNKLTEINQI
jgi:hypothetical protein